MRKHYSEVELINSSRYKVNATDYLSELTQKHDVVVQYVDYFKPAINALEEDFENDEVSYALYEESTEKGGGGEEYISHILYDPIVGSVAKFLVEASAQWLVGKAANGVYEKVKSLILNKKLETTENYGIYFIAKIDNSEHWFYFNTAYTEEATNFALDMLKTMVRENKLASNSSKSVYFFDYSSKQWIRTNNAW